jgi:Mce-associated membrane protein
MSIAVGATRSLRNGLRRWQGVLCILLVAVAVAITIGALVIVYRAHERHDRDAAIVASTKEFTAALLNLQYTQPGDILNKLDGLTTGELAGQLAAGHVDFDATLRDSRVRSTGSAVTSAIVSATNTDSTALVAAKAMVTNAHGDQPQQRSLRWELTLERRGERWLVSELEFVP